jgi:hypothetical protein
MDRNQDDGAPHREGNKQSPNDSHFKPGNRPSREVAASKSARHNAIEQEYLRRADMSATNSQSDRVPGRPPSQTRFKPGQSGNPAGRPKGSKNLKTLVESVLGKLVTLTENGKQVRKTAGEVVLRRLAQDAMKGDHKARELLLRYAHALGLGENGEERKAFVRAGDDDGLMPDKAALRRILRRFDNFDFSEEAESEHER